MSYGIRQKSSWVRLPKCLGKSIVLQNRPTHDHRNAIGMRIYADCTEITGTLRSNGRYLESHRSQRRCSEHSMTLGMGIFLSTLMLSAVIIYALTMNRWDWRKIIFRSFISVGVAVILSAIAVAVFILKDRFLPLAIQKEYAGVQLGMTMDEVKYAIGYPDAVQNPTSKRKVK